MAFGTNPVFSQARWSAATAGALDSALDADISPRSGGVMTLNGTIVRAGMLLGVVAVCAALGWWAPPSMVGLTLIAALVAVGTGLWAQLSSRVRPGVMFVYAVAEGLLLGAISESFAANSDVPVLQVVLATFMVSGAVLMGYRAGWLSTSPKWTRVIMLAAFGYFGFLLVSFISTVLGGPNLIASPLGLVMAGLGVLMGAYFLVQDFTMIENGVRNGIAEENEWRAAFGLTVSLIWMYLQLLRIFARR